MHTQTPVRRDGGLDPNGHASLTKHLTFLPDPMTCSQPLILKVLPKLLDVLTAKDTVTIYCSLCPQSNPCSMLISACYQINST